MNKKIIFISIALVALIVSGGVLVNRTNILGKAEISTDPVTTQPIAQSVTIPKYIFLFIGDGMSYPQFQVASDYLEVRERGNNFDSLGGGCALSFMRFPTTGSATTFDLSSFCPDSASTATSIATGYKTYSGTINMDATQTKSYETIAEKLKDQKDYKIGIITSMNLNHATPAAFYAHQPSRKNYYEIGCEMVSSGFDYLAGGELIYPRGRKEDQISVYDLAAQAGYDLVYSQNEAEMLEPGERKTLIIGETLADGGTLSYEIDRRTDEWSLRDYVAKGIEMLNNDNGFFIMVEGGKIDQACHANDAVTAIWDVLALDQAVEEALEFYDQHPDETLILVTGDHETGGMTIGYAGTNYNTYLANLTNQKVSYAKFNSDYIADYREKKTSFNIVLQDIKSSFGLITANDPDAESNPEMVLTDYELQRLRTAYDKTMGSNIDISPQEEYILYGTREPLSVTITHLLNNKSGINFASYSHTGLPVAVFAKGVGSECFSGFYDNIMIYKYMENLLQIN